MADAGNAAAPFTLNLLTFAGLSPRLTLHSLICLKINRKGRKHENITQDTRKKTEVRSALGVWEAKTSIYGKDKPHSK